MLNMIERLDALTRDWQSAATSAAADGVSARDAYNTAASELQAVLTRYRRPPSVAGTSQHGYLDATTAEITALYGPPNEPTPDGKIRVRWVIRTGHGVGTIYDLTAFTAPTSEDQVVTWHLGGVNVDCARDVADRILAARKAASA
jgi:hypothetical protein